MLELDKTKYEYSWVLASNDCLPEGVIYILNKSSDSVSFLKSKKQLGQYFTTDKGLKNALFKFIKNDNNFI